MRKLSMFALLLLCGIFLITPPSFSQEMKDQLYWVREEVVKVDMWEKYESTSKEWVKMMTEAGLDYPFMRASQRDDGHYYYLFPLDNYAAIDKMQGIFGAAIEKIGKDKWAKFMVENESSMVTHKDFIAKWSAEYSYVPKEPRLKPEEANFIHWMFFHYKLENRKEIMDIMKEWKKLYQDKNISNGYSIWLIELGLDNNMIALTENFKDGADFYTAQKEDNALMEAEAGVLWGKMSKFITSIENVYGNPRPDLGFVKK
ncbi:MAG TPA: hypothetical protein PKE38_02170 [Ignavibacteriaceae bacterium]|nr:hypothetical protein [Ignavibacteriaceae bacterium]